MPPWYRSTEQWLMGHGWPFMVLLGLAIVATTIFFILYGKAVPLAVWLAYLILP